MMRKWCCALAIAGMLGPGMTACEPIVAVAPSDYVSNVLVAPVAMTFAPTTVVAPLTVQAAPSSFAVAPFSVQVLAAPVGVRSGCIAPRARVRQFLARPRVTVRVR